MKAAIVNGKGLAPVYGDFADPQPSGGLHLITVTASALTHLTRSRAAGTHYSSKGGFPFIPGVDGTGITEEGQPVYFVMPETPFGGLAERTLVKSQLCVELPAGLNPVRAAALANPGMSSWAALQERARFSKGETVLIHGATGISGRLAVQVAKFLGAKKVIATGRNPDVLRALPALGADVIIDLKQDADALEKEFQQQFSEGVNVVLDYLWGESALILLVAAAKAAPEAVPIRFVNIGSVSGPEISLPSAVLRSSALELMGSGISSIPLPCLVQAVREVFAAVGPGHFEIPIKRVPFAKIGEQWSAANAEARIVFTL